jgi:hypothetical protein
MTTDKHLKPMIGDIKRDSRFWGVEKRLNRGLQWYSDSTTALRRVRCGPSGQPNILAKTRMSAIAEACKLRGISEHTNTSSGPSYGLSQTPRYPQTDSGYGGSEPSVYEPAEVSRLGDGQPNPRSIGDRCLHEGIAGAGEAYGNGVIMEHSKVSTSTPDSAMQEVSVKAEIEPHRSSIATCESDYQKEGYLSEAYVIEPEFYELPLNVRFHYRHFLQYAFKMCTPNTNLPVGFDIPMVTGSRLERQLASSFKAIISRDLQLARTAICATLNWARDHKVDGATSILLLLVREEASKLLGPEHAFTVWTNKLSSSTQTFATQFPSWQNCEADRSQPDSLLKNDAAEVPKLPSPERNSPKSTSSSEGENSFMESIDSDEAAHFWEMELDPCLHSLRSKLIQVLVASYIDAASLVVNLQTTQYLAAANSPSGHAKSSSTSSSSSLSDTKPSSMSTGKRRRDNDSNDNDNDEDHEDQQRQPTRKKLRHTDTSISIDGRLLACPYCKYDPTRYSERNIEEKNYRGCSSIYLTSISRVKQHLYRVHKRPDYYCACCFNLFQDEAALSAHSRIRPACEVKEACFAEKMATEQVNLIKRRTIGKTPSETWFEIYKILFPHAPLPETPYVETVSPGAIQRFTDHFYRQAGSRLAALVQTELQGRMLLERDQQRILDSALESAIGQLVWQTGPHTSFEDAEPEMNVAQSEPDFAASPNVQASRDNNPVHEQLEISLGDQRLPTQPNFEFGVNTDDPYSFYNNLNSIFTGHVPVDGHEDQNSCPLLSDPIEDGGLNDWFERELPN